MTQLYYVSLWKNRLSVTLPEETWFFPLVANDDHALGLTDGLNAIMDWLEKNPKTPRFMSVGSCYSGNHSLDGWEYNNAIVVEFVPRFTTAVDTALADFGYKAITVTSNEGGKQPKEKRRIAIIPLDGEVASSSDYKRLSSMPVETFRVKGLLSGDNCTFIFHVDPSEPAQEIDSEGLYSTDMLQSGMRTCLQNWKAK